MSYNFDSKNMSYIYHVEYFDNLDLLSNSSNQVELIIERNHAIEKFFFPDIDQTSRWKMMPNLQTFHLYTCYPGLMVGLGSTRGLAIDGSIDCGFTFDHVTGIPYLPGSELKGALRSCFPGDDKEETVSAEYENYIKGLLKNKTGINILELKDQIFENGDVFLGGYPVFTAGERSLILTESITPHIDKFKNPIPLTMLKVKPDVEFEFCFLLKDYEKEGRVLLTANEKLLLFKSLILDMGAGAKTNVGFGRLAECKSGKNNFIDGNENNGNNHTQRKENRGGKAR